MPLTGLLADENATINTGSATERTGTKNEKLRRVKQYQRTNNVVPSKLQGLPTVKLIMPLLVFVSRNYTYFTLLIFVSLPEAML